MVGWQMQDLKCKKCGVLQGEDAVFREHCGCGGVWEGVLVSKGGKEGVRERMRVLERVAGMYGLRMLEGVVEGVRRMGMF